MSAPDRVETTVLPDGRSVAWRETGCGRPLVLLHGWSMASTSFAPLTAELGGDFRLIAPDLRGHGDSADGEGHDLAAFAADLHLWLDILGLQQVDLLGWSLGAMVALHLALQRPERVSRLILLAATPRFVSDVDWPHGLADAQVRVLARNYRRAPDLTRVDFFSQQFAPGEISAAAVNAHLAMQPSPTLAAALGGLETLRCADLRPSLPKVVQPTLVLHGSVDPIVPIGAGRALTAGLPHAALVELSGLGHAPHLSRPDLCAAAIRNFLR